MTAKPVPEHISDERPKLDANEIWEFLFNRTKDAVPEELTNEILGDLAAHINKLWIDPLAELQHRREAEAEPAFWHNGQRQMITNAVKVGKPVDEDDARWISRFDQPLYAASPSSPASALDALRSIAVGKMTASDAAYVARTTLSALGEHP